MSWVPRFPPGVRTGIQRSYVRGDPSSGSESCTCVSDVMDTGGGIAAASIADAGECGNYLPATAATYVATAVTSPPCTMPAGIVPLPRWRPFVTASSTSAAGGLSWSRFGPTLPTA